jgi:hypothetical protein
MRRKNFGKKHCTEWFTRGSVRNTAGQCAIAVAFAPRPRDRQARIENEALVHSRYLMLAFSAETRYVLIEGLLLHVLKG